MKSEKRILIAFLLNTFFSLCELAGGIFTGSVAILSDAVHDMGDAISIGASYFLERKSSRKPDNSHTFGYGRYSVLGAAITDVILIAGSLLVIYKGIGRIISPVQINSEGMMAFAAFGFVTNLVAAFFTGGEGSMNQKAVNLHLLEDVLGWAAVLVGSVVIRFTGLYVIDPIMSVAVAVFILCHAVRSLGKILDIFLEKTPAGIDVEKIKKHLLEIEGVLGVHHIHIRSFDGERVFMSLHAVIDSENALSVKRAVKQELRAQGIFHVTLEAEGAQEHCDEKDCTIEGGHSHCGHCH